MSYFDTPTPEDVQTVDQLIEYVRFRCGTLTRMGDRKAFLTHWSTFNKENPWVEIHVLAKVVDWAKANKLRVPTLISLFDAAAEAQSRKAIPELDYRYHQKNAVEEQIREALRVETDPNWRKRFWQAQGRFREEALREWQANRAPMLV